MEILIEGTGALACLFAAFLSKVGHRVTMSGTWKEGLDALKSYGARLVEDSAHEHSYPVDVINRHDSNGQFEVALILVKSWQTEQVAKHLTSCLMSEGIALTLQNGLGNQETLIRALGVHRVCLGITTVGSTLIAPGIVRMVGNAQVAIGRHPGVDTLTQLLQQAGFDVSISTDTQSLLWGKLIINAVINPLTALLRIPNGELLIRTDIRELMREITDEASHVAASKSILLPYPDPLAAVEQVANLTAGNYSSMYHDLQRNARTEINEINGAIIMAGKEMGIATPINQTLWHLVRASHKGEYQDL